MTDSNNAKQDESQPSPEDNKEEAMSDSGAESKPETGITEQPPASAPETAITDKPAAAVATKPAPPKATAAKKPPPKKPAGKKGVDRRFFLFTWIGVAWTTFCLSMIGMTLGSVRFMFPNVLSEPPSTFKVGDINNFEENIVTDRYKEQGVWIVRSRQGDSQGRDVIYALSTTCTHLGCTPNWLESDKKFKCPCHGSGFKISGINFEGPAPRPLERHAVTRSEDNQVVVDKSRKFQQERGEWEDPSSYILL